MFERGGYYMGNSNLTTKSRVFEAFRALAIEKKLMKNISVVDICEKAGISRQTFYNHFVDKFEIGQWFFDSIATQYLFEAGRSLSYHDANLLNNRAFAANRAFVEAMFQDNGYQSFLSYARRTRRATLEETITEYKGVALTEDIKLLLDYHVEAETYLVTRWICEYPDKSPDSIADIHDRAIPAALFEIVGNPTPGCHGPSGLFLIV